MQIFADAQESLFHEVILSVNCNKEPKGFALFWNTDCFQANSPDVKVFCQSRHAWQGLKELHAAAGNIFSGLMV